MWVVEIMSSNIDEGIIDEAGTDNTEKLNLQ